MKTIYIDEPQTNTSQTLEYIFISSFFYRSVCSIPSFYPIIKLSMNNVFPRKKKQNQYISSIIFVYATTFTPCP